MVHDYVAYIATMRILNHTHAWGVPSAAARQPWHPHPPPLPQAATKAAAWS